MSSFWTKEELRTSVVSAKPLSCHVCGLAKGPRNPKIEPYGNFKKYIMVIGEAPGESEDRVGKPWQGRAGRLLVEMFEELGMNLFEDCVSINAVNCRPPMNRAPIGKELNCCRDVKVLKAIEQYKPDIIIPLGGAAITSILDHRWRDNLGGISKWRGWTIPDKQYRAWICPTFHPSYVMRMESREVNVIWKEDLKRAFSLVGIKRPRWKKPKIHYIEDLEPLREIRNGIIAFDYETTGLKPQSVGHRIVCASVAFNEDEAYTFLMPKKKADRLPLVELLQNQAVDKVAANMKFEDTWTVERLGIQVRAWLWDTMQASHVLDNRFGISGLKFQAYVRLGELGYDSEVASYLKTKGRDGNAINRVFDLLSTFDGAQKLLKYCAFDSIFEYRLAMCQMQELEYDFLPF